MYIVMYMYNNLECEHNMYFEFQCLVFILNFRIIMIIVQNVRNFSQKYIN